jgi:hypothetical protein
MNFSTSFTAEVVWEIFVTSAIELEIRLESRDSIRDWAL